MKRIVHGEEYVEFPESVCKALDRAYIINSCGAHDYHPAFSEGDDDPRDEEKIWAALVIIAKAYGEGVQKLTEDEIKEAEDKIERGES